MYLINVSNKLKLINKWIRSTVYSLNVFFLIFIFSCTNYKEKFEQAQRKATAYEIYLIIAIALVILVGAILLVVGNMMGSKSLKDSRRNESKENNNE